MKIPCLKNRSRTRLSLLLLALSVVPVAFASELSIQAFSASYDLHKGKRYIAITELKLEREGEHWRWSSLTTARGIYAWFTRKRPYSETSFSRIENKFLLQEILIADAGKKKSLESAGFDWSKGHLDVFRKGKRNQLRLQAEVYDYQSVHLLTAAMGQQQLKETTVDFYRKGKLVKSQLIYSGQQQLDVNGKSMDASVYEQKIDKSDSKIKYYYDAENPLLPLRIEKFEEGEKPAVLTLRQVDWNL